MEERRRESDKQLDILTERLKGFSEKYDKDEKNAEEWRNRFCSKLDKINERLNCLPCKEAEQVVNNVKNDVGWLQKGAVGIICALFGMGIWVGTVNTIVAANTHKWEVLEPEHETLIKDVEVLKEKSYGYRGIKVVQDGNMRT